MKITMILAAAALALSASAATAETTVIRHDDGDRSVTVRRHSDRGMHRGWVEHRSYGVNRCRTITVRREADNGDTVVRRIRKCN
jgi:hypothetical protein